MYTMITFLLSSYSYMALAEDRPIPKRDLPNTATHPSVVTEPARPNVVTKSIEVPKPEDVIDEAIASGLKATPTDELDKAMTDAKEEGRSADKQVGKEVGKGNIVQNRRYVSGQNKLHKKRHYKRTRYKNGKKRVIDNDGNPAVVPDKQ